MFMMCSRKAANAATDSDEKAWLLQKGAALTPAEPWTTMPNTGAW